jgi:hypothetical protein
MTQPSKPLVPQTSLTFEELRLANLVHPHGKAHPLGEPLAMLEKLDDEMLTYALAEMVIQTDWLAASRGIDLQLAIRNMFARGDSLHELGRRRIDDVERKFTRT